MKHHGDIHYVRGLAAPFGMRGNCMNTVVRKFTEVPVVSSENDVIKAILSRHSVSPKRVVAPGPDADQILELMSAAAAAPDHGKLRPWRFIN